MAEIDTEDQVEELTEEQAEALAEERAKRNEYPTIEEQKQHFKRFSKLPIAICTIIIVCGAMSGIATAIINESALSFFICLILGVVSGLVSFAILRILLSSQILTVLYLEKISQLLEPAPLEEDEVFDETENNPQSEGEKTEDEKPIETGNVEETKE